MNLRTRFSLFVTLVCSAFSTAFGALEESKSILLPTGFYHCELSPNGKYAALYRRTLIDNKVGSKTVGPAIYGTQVLILDLETKQAVLAGRSEDGDDEFEYDDQLDRARWAKDGNLLLLSYEEIMLVDPATGFAKKRRKLHSRVLDLGSLPLLDAWDEPLIFYDINWGRGAATSLFSFSPKTGKLRKLNQPGLVKDTIVRVYKHAASQALTLRPYAKDSAEGMTWELGTDGEMLTYPFTLPTEWEFAETDRSILNGGEILMIRHLEDGDAIAELRLFNFRKDEFVGGTALVRREDLELASSALTRGSVNALRAAKGAVPFRSIANEAIVWLVGQLRNAYPLVSVRKTSESEDGKLIAIRVSSQNRPAAIFTFDVESSKLGKLVEGHPEWAERKMSAGRYIYYDSSEERGGTGVASYIPAVGESKKAPLVISISGEPLYDYDWGFSSAKRFLSAEGVDTLQVMVPWSLQLAVARSTDEATLEAALDRCSEFLGTVVTAAKSEGVISSERTDGVYYCLYGGSAALVPALPKIEGVAVKEAIALNPRLMVGYDDISLARLDNLENRPRERYVDSKAWLRNMTSRKQILDTPVKVVWREDDVSRWTGENSVEEQIESLRSYCKDVGLEFELDRLDEGAWRYLESWKMNAALTVGIWESITGEDSELLSKWYEGKR